MRNPKQDGSILFDCVPQSGKCPMNCNQCYFNRGYYRKTPFIDPDPSGIVRMNCGHDSNIERDKVIEAAAGYKHVFFNTSIPKFDFPGPVVFTANHDEERGYTTPPHPIPKNLMAIRLRVSSTNLGLIRFAIRDWSPVPIILTFMAYYDYRPETPLERAFDPKKNLSIGEFLVPLNETKNYVWKVRHTNSYWCAKQTFIDSVVEQYPGVHCCKQWCKDCGLCEKLYWEHIDGL